MLLQDFFESHYLAHNPSTSPKTIVLYRNTFRLFGQWLGRRPVIADLDNVTVGKYLADLYRSPRRPATVNKERAQLLAVWRMAHTLGMVRLGPLIKKLKEPESTPTALSIDDLKQLRLSFDRLEGSTSRMPNKSIIAACFDLQYTTAERIGAVLQLRWDDVDFTNRSVTFRAEVRKCGTRGIVRTVPAFALRSVEALRPWNSSDEIFPGMYGTTKIHLLYNRLFKRAGVSRPKGKSSHLLRSTHATYLNLAGGNATESLGHSSPDVTRKSYLDPRFDQKNYWEMLPDLEKTEN